MARVTGGAGAREPLRPRRSLFSDPGEKECGSPCVCGERVEKLREAASRSANERLRAASLSQPVPPLAPPPLPPPPPPPLSPLFSASCSADQCLSPVLRHRQLPPCFLVLLPNGSLPKHYLSFRLCNEISLYFCKPWGEDTTPCHAVSGDFHRLVNSPVGVSQVYTA